MKKILSLTLFILLLSSQVFAGFSGFLKADTAATLQIGPFLDSTDGNTEEGALTISQADVRLSKNGGNFAQKNEATSCTYDEVGYYSCPIDGTDTDTEGRLKVVVHEAGSLLVVQEYMVVNANVFDSLYAAATTDYLQVDTIQLSGDATAADNSEAFFDGTGYAGTNNVIPTVTTLTGHTAQTGDSYARIGAPAGVSISADIAAAQADLDLYDTDAEHAAAIWNAATASYGGAGTYGQASEDTLGDTNELQTDWANGGRLDLILDAILAMLDDGRAEPGQGAPPVNADAMTKLDYIYKWYRNKKDNDGSTTQYYDDAGTTVDHKQTTTDAAGTTTINEIVSGP